VLFRSEGVVGGEVSVGPCKYGFEPEGVRYGDVGVGNRGRAGVLTRDRFVTRRDGWLELYVQRQDAYTVRVYDVSGRMVHALDGVGPGTYRIPMRVMSDGAYVVDVR